MTRFPCPYLNGEVELGEEREGHIAEEHPDFLPEHRALLGQTLVAPDQVRRSRRFGNARLFSRWYPELRGGKHVVVIVVTDPGGLRRNWVITAYLARKLAEGDVEWRQS